MENSAVSLEKVALRYGLYTCAGLIVYFLMMKVIGLVHIIELRSLNLFIMLAGLWLSMNYYKRYSSSHMNYFEGIGLGALTAAIAVIPFSVFLLFYMLVDVGFMETIRANEDFGQWLNPYLLAFIITFEGMVSGLMASFVLMQYLKKKEAGAVF